MKFRIKPAVVYVSFFILGATAFFATTEWIIPAIHARSKSADGDHIVDRAITKDSKEIWRDEDALYSYVKKFGPAETMAHLNALSTTYGSCHDPAHKAGRFSYEIYSDESFKECSAECHSGCYHGATEAYFKEHGTANLSENLNTLCGDELNAFFSHQCVHGIGHGLMAWTSYEIFDALESCDLLDRRQDSCWTGVFMENIVGGLAKSEAEKNPEQADHFTEYLSDDPHYPCNHPTLEEKYRGSCYFLQTSRMVQLFGGDFKKVANSCATVPDLYRRTCFESMGRDIGGTYRGNPSGAIAACAFAPKGNFRLGCLSGAVQDTFWDPSGADAAIGFCKLVTDTTEKSACYQTIFGRMPEILSGVAERTSFCEKAEVEYQGDCLARVNN
ncbi:MAG: hypothetical protein AAB518_01065 [Patescibacteria group bacterium]